MCNKQIFRMILSKAKALDSSLTSCLYQLDWSLRYNFTQENTLRIAKEAKTQKALIYE